MTKPPAPCRLRIDVAFPMAPGSIPAANEPLLANGIRLRFNAPVLLSRQDGMRKILKAMKAGYQFYYLPDMDFGRKGTVFVPFFGVPASTAVGLSYIARTTGAAVVGDRVRGPGAAGAGLGLAALDELVEDRIQLVLRDADALIDHLPKAVSECL